VKLREITGGCSQAFAFESVTEEIDKATPEEKRTVEKQHKKEQKEVNDLKE